MLNDARRLLKEGLTDPGMMRPFIDEDGLPYISIFKGGDKNDPTNFESIPVNNAALRYDEWKRLDDVVIKVARQRLVGFEDLRRNGLVYPLNNAMATTVLQWEEMSDAMEAFVSISPVRRGDGDQVDFATKSIPIPIVHVDYQLGERLLLESRNRGNGLDTTNAEQAARRVAEKLEDMLFGTASTLVYGGGTIYSYQSFPDKTTVNLAIDWDASGITAALILADVVAMKNASIADKHYGPWMLYVPTLYDTILDEDYDVAGSSLLTIRERIMKIDGIQGIKVVDRLAANKVLLIQMTSDTVDLIDGMPIQNVEWNSEGRFVHHYKVMTIQIPRIKSDYLNQSGIILLE